jgi:hypothetical protein
MGTNARPLCCGFEVNIRDADSQLDLLTNDAADKQQSSQYAGCDESLRAVRCDATRNAIFIVYFSVGIFFFK